MKCAVALALAVGIVLMASGTSLACGIQGYMHIPKYIGEEFHDPYSTSSRAYGYYFNYTLRYYLGPDFFKANDPSASHKPLDFKDYNDKVDGILASHGLAAVTLEPQSGSDYYFESAAHQCQSNTFRTALDFMEAAGSDKGIGEGLTDIIAIRHRVLSICNFKDAALPEKLRSDIERLKGIYKSAPGYLTYLEALTYFYSNDQPRADDQLPSGDAQATSDTLSSGSALKAGSLFEQLSQDDFYKKPGMMSKIMSIVKPDPTPLWLKEASTYLTGRSLLIASQKNWDGYSSSTKGLDMNLLGKSEAAFANYMKVYPDGKYVFSADGIRRKILFLKEKYDELDNELVNHFDASYEMVLKHPGDDLYRERFLDVNTEVLRLYDGSKKIPYEHPLMMAAYVFKNLGFAGDNESDSQAKDEATKAAEVINNLEKYKQHYAKYAALYELIRNIALMRLGKHKELVDTFPALKLEDDFLIISNFIFKAQALEKLNNYGEARSIWKTIRGFKGRGEDDFPGNSLMLNYLATGDIQGLASVDAAFTFDEDKEASTDEKPDSVQMGLVRIAFDYAFRALADDESLKAIMSAADTTNYARSLAAQVLLERYLLTDKYDQFIEVYNKAGRPKTFDEIQGSVMALSKDGKDVKAIVTVGAFVYAHGYKSAYAQSNSYVDGSIYDYVREHVLLKDQALKDRYAKSIQSDEAITPPIRYFVKAAELAVNSGKNDSEAEALYYLTQCYRRVYDNNCTWGKSDYDVSKRKEWFKRLHKKYSDTEWARSARYYY